MLVFIIILALSCFISFIIIKIYNIISLKSQTENFKIATHIYLRKKMDILPKLIGEIRYITGETDELIKIIRLRNQFNESMPINQALSLVHELNRDIGFVLQKIPNVESLDQLQDIKKEWYLVDSNLKENSSLYINCARRYNSMLDDFFCQIVVKLFKYEEEKI